MAKGILDGTTVRVRKSTLPNAIQVVSAQDKASSMASIVLAALRNPGEEHIVGGDHLWEHLTVFPFTGEAQLRRLREYNRYFSELDASISSDAVQIESSFPAAHLRSAIRTLAACFTAKADPAARQREINRVKLEIRMNRNDPEETLSDAVMAKLWCGEGAGRSIYGTVHLLNKIRHRDLTIASQRFHQGRRVVLSYVGPESHARICQLVTKNLGWMAEGLPIQTSTPPTQSGVVVIRKATSGVYCHVAIPLLRVGATRINQQGVDMLDAMGTLAAHYFGSSASSVVTRLFNNCGMSYGVNTSLLEHDSSFTLMTSGHFHRRQLNTALKMLIDVFRHPTLYGDEPTFRAVQNRYINSLLDQSSDPSTRASIQCRHLAISGRLYSFERHIKAVRAISFASFKRFLSEAIHPTKGVLGLCGNLDVNAVPAFALAAFRPAEIESDEGVA